VQVVQLPELEQLAAAYSALVAAYSAAAYFAAACSALAVAYSAAACSASAAAYSAAASPFPSQTSLAGPFVAVLQGPMLLQRHQQHPLFSTSHQKVHPLTPLFLQVQQLVAAAVLSPSAAQACQAASFAHFA